MVTHYYYIHINMTITIYLYFQYGIINWMQTKIIVVEFFNKFKNLTNSLINKIVWHEPKHIFHFVVSSGPLQSNSNSCLASIGWR